jgi:hypothetical protein
MQARDPTASWLRVPHPKCNVMYDLTQPIRLLARKPLSETSESHPTLPPRIELPTNRIRLAISDTSVFVCCDRRAATLRATRPCVDFHSVNEDRVKEDGSGPELCRALFGARGRPDERKVEQPTCNWPADCGMFRIAIMRLLAQRRALEYRAENSQDASAGGDAVGQAAVGPSTI